MNKKHFPSGSGRALAAGAGVLVLSGAFAGTALAAPKKQTKTPPPRMDTSSCYAEAVVDGETGKLIPERSRNADKIVLKASIAKLDTALVVHDLMDARKIDPQEKITFLQPRKRGVDTCTPPDAKNGVPVTLSVHDMMRAALIISDNQAAYALGKLAEERSGKTIEQLFTAKAKQLGLKKTRTISPNGINDAASCSGIADKDPKVVAEKLNNGSIDTRHLNTSTPEDIARLALAAARIPYLRGIMSEPHFDGYGGKPIQATNKLIESNVIGKTGYTVVAGGNFVGVSDGYGITTSHCTGLTPSDKKGEKPMTARFELWERARNWLAHNFRRSTHPDAMADVQRASILPSFPSAFAAPTPAVSVPAAATARPPLDNTGKTPDSGQTAEPEKRTVKADAALADALIP